MVYERGLSVANDYRHVHREDSVEMSVSQKNKFEGDDQGLVNRTKVGPRKVSIRNNRVKGMVIRLNNPIAHYVIRVPRSTNHIGQLNMCCVEFDG
jgi:hypothetical protein